MGWNILVARYFYEFRDSRVHLGIASVSSCLRRIHVNDCLVCHVFNVLCLFPIGQRSRRGCVASGIVNSTYIILK